MHIAWAFVLLFLALWWLYGGVKGVLKYVLGFSDKRKELIEEYEARGVSVQGVIIDRRHRVGRRKEVVAYYVVVSVVRYVPTIEDQTIVYRYVYNNFAATKTKYIGEATKAPWQHPVPTNSIDLKVLPEYPNSGYPVYKLKGAVLNPECGFCCSTIFGVAGGIVSAWFLVLLIVFGGELPYNWSSQPASTYLYPTLTSFLAVPLFAWVGRKAPEKEYDAWRREVLGLSLGSTDNSEDSHNAEETEMTTATTKTNEITVAKAIKFSEAAMMKKKKQYAEVSAVEIV